MHSVEKVTPENIYFAFEFTTLSTLEPELWPFMEFGSHFGGHLDLYTLDGLRYC